MSEIEIRSARSEDRAAVLAFCANTWDWGDYIEYVWDEWLNDPAGQLLVALSSGQPVGIVHLSMLNETDVWQEGMRVDPAYRKQGIATRLVFEAAAEAMRRGATIIRLLTESTNEASIHLTEAMHYRRISIFAPYTALPLNSVPGSNSSQDTLTLARPEDLDEIIMYLNVSNIFPAVGGMYFPGYTGYRISDQLLNEKIQAGHIYLLHRWERLDGLAIAEPSSTRHGKQLSIGYIDGTTEAISFIAYTLRQKLFEMGLEKIHANVPDLMMTRDAFTGAEYEWEGNLFYTYERGLV